MLSGLTGMLMGIFEIGRHVLRIRRMTTAAAVPQMPPARETKMPSVMSWRKMS